MAVISALLGFGGLVLGFVFVGYIIFKIVEPIYLYFKKPVDIAEEEERKRKKTEESERQRLQAIEDQNKYWELQDLRRLENRSFIGNVLLLFFIFLFWLSLLK